MELSSRKKEILCALVEDYIKDASPITSGGIKDRHLNNVSSATLRNELNALEAMGFLRQLHTSSGRIPTSEAYRFYVSSLLSDLKVSEDRIESVKNILIERTKSISEIVSELAKIVSEATNYPAVVFMNGYDNLILEEIKIVPLIANNSLVLIKTTHGIINNTLNVSASSKACEDASKNLTKTFAGKTIKEMMQAFESFEKSFKDELADYKNLVENLLESIKKVLSTKNIAVRSAGANKLLLDSANNIKDAQKVFGLLEDEKELEGIFEESSDDISVDVMEGSEQESGYSVIKAPIIIGGKSVGTFGVLGPQRMDYGMIASAIKFVAAEIENLDKIDGIKE
ncbi:MAG: heat-inducible transcription repressor HrcA [Clostridia bacterium]|nr:heat-inducible transcription repressor HrcA [Clostridia bacterium]